MDSRSLDGVADLVPSDSQAQLSDSSSRIFFVCVLQSVSSGNLRDRFRLGFAMILDQNVFIDVKAFFYFRIYQ